jgi:1-acyl-sn-glycerol-3-phosphate acyltransferase
MGDRIIKASDAGVAASAPRLTVGLRSLAFHIVYYAHTLATLIVFTPIYFFLPQPLCVGVGSAWARRALWLLRVICGVQVRYEGLEHLPKTGFILAHKHQSELDMILILALLKNPAFIVKRELLYVPLFGLWAVKARMIFVSRGSRQVALEQITRGSRRAIAKGRPVVIAPEGTRRVPGAEPAFKYGVTHLYKELGIPIVPAALNSGVYWPWWGFFRYPGTVVMSFLTPIAPGLADDEFSARLVTEIEYESDRLLAEADAAVPRPRLAPSAEERLAKVRAARAGSER